MVPGRVTQQEHAPGLRRTGSRDEAIKPSKPTPLKVLPTKGSITSRTQPTRHQEPMGDIFHSNYHKYILISFSPYFLK